MRQVPFDGRGIHPTSAVARLGRAALASVFAASAAMTGLGASIANVAAASQSAFIALALGDTQPTNVEIEINAVDDGLIADWLVDPGLNNAYGLGFQGSISVDEVTWNAIATSEVAYDDTDLRQGRTLELEDTQTPGPGSVSLSAVLKDATGKALSGRTIEFTLGTQTVAAVIDLNGVVAAAGHARRHLPRFSSGPAGLHPAGPVPCPPLAPFSWRGTR